MNLPISPLVLTKLRVPAIRTRLISRARLVDLLTSEHSASFILVCTPAGYGKTTLLADWARSLTNKGTAVAWYALDPGDDDPIPFKAYLIASLLQALGPTPELVQIAQLLPSTPEIGLEQILPAAINALTSIERKCVLILDDYHLITSPAIHSALAYFLDHLPETLRIAIGSRSDPPLHLARLRARGGLLEVRTDSLRFKEDETAQFLNEVMQLGLSPEEVMALEKRTEGWAAGLQLAAIVLRSQHSGQGRTDKEQVIASFTGSHRYLVEYLLEEVVNRQPEEVQSFLLKTSILERMCAPLCDHLQGIGEAESPIPLSPIPQVLEYLEKSNLFLVPLDDDRTWYRYHHLFRDFLQTRLNKTRPELIPWLHRAACEWLAGKGLLREAARHAFQTQDWAYAAAFVEQYSFTLIIHSEISTIYEWCSAFPEEVMQRRPMLCILQGLALAYGFRRQNRARVEARLSQADQLIAKLEDVQEAFGLNELASVARTFLAFAPDPDADSSELLAHGQRMLSNYPEGDPGQLTGLLLAGYANLARHDAHAAGEVFEAARQIALRERLYFGIVESTFHMARLAHSQGQLARAAALCRQGQNDIAAMLDDPEQALPALGSLDIALGCVLLEYDRLDEAEQHLRRGLDRMGGGMNLYYLMTGCIALFRLYEIQGQSAEALKSLDRLDAAWPDITFCTHGLRVTHRLRTAPEDPLTLADAAAWRRSHERETASASDRTDMNPPGMGPFGAAEAYYLADLAWTRAQLAIGQAQPVLTSLARQIELSSAHRLTNRVIELSLLEAQAWRAESEDQRAWAALERAFVLAQPESYVRIFDQGPALTRLLHEAERHAGVAQRGIIKEYIERIIAALSQPEASALGREGFAARSAQTPTGESLSQRELEVLRLMALGASNREIAEQLVISVGTVKSHINHILGKLDAHNRTEAVARARTLGLLDI